MHLTIYYSFNERRRLRFYSCCHFGTITHGTIKINNSLVLWFVHPRVYCTAGVSIAFKPLHSSVYFHRLTVRIGSLPRLSVRGWRCFGFHPARRLNRCPKDTSVTEGHNTVTSVVEDNNKNRQFHWRLTVKIQNQKLPTCSCPV